jgi:hypothetical protein
MLVTASTIGTACGAPSTGFVIQLYLLDARDVESVYEPADGELLCGGIVVRNGAPLVELPLRYRSGTYQESQNTSNDGLGFNVTLSLSYPAVNNPSVVAWANANKKRRWVAIFKTVTGEVLLAGDPENGLRLSIGRNGQERGMIGLSLNGSFWHTMWLLPTIDLEELFGGPKFVSSGFSSGFYI